jgi:hypothetical protein
MKLSVPSEITVFVEIILDRLGAEFDPEHIPVKIEPYAKEDNCYMSVEEKVKRDGGKVHYGWGIFQSDIICEAIRHAVWESPDGDLVDITPKNFEVESIMFVSDNDFVYDGQLVDNVRVNITNNPIVDDFIQICETLEKLYTYGARIGDYELDLPEPVKDLVPQYEQRKGAYLNFINAGGNPKSMCPCNRGRQYNNCCGKNLRSTLKTDLNQVKHDMAILKKTAPPTI